MTDPIIAAGVSLRLAHYASFHNTVDCVLPDDVLVLIVQFIVCNTDPVKTLRTLASMMRAVKCIRHAVLATTGWTRPLDAVEWAYATVRGDAYVRHFAGQYRNPIDHSEYALYDAVVQADLEQLVASTVVDRYKDTTASKAALRHLQGVLRPLGMHVGFVASFLDQILPTARLLSTLPSTNRTATLALAATTNAVHFVALCDNLCGALCVSLCSAMCGYSDHPVCETVCECSSMDTDSDGAADTVICADPRFFVTGAADMTMECGITLYDPRFLKLYRKDPEMQLHADGCRVVRMPLLRLAVEHSTCCGSEAMRQWVASDWPMIRCMGDQPDSDERDLEYRSLNRSMSIEAVMSHRACRARSDYWSVDDLMFTRVPQSHGAHWLSRAKDDAFNRFTGMMHLWKYHFYRDHVPLLPTGMELFTFVQQAEFQLTPGVPLPRQAVEHVIQDGATWATLLRIADFTGDVGVLQQLQVRFRGTKPAESRKRSVSPSAKERVRQRDVKERTV